MANLHDMIQAANMVKGKGGDGYSRAETDSLLNAKADKSATYTKTETDTLLTDKQNILTAAQLAATDSGITAAKVANYDDVYAVLNYSVLNHNGIYRGKDLTNVYTIDEMYAKIADGSFNDLYLGDYFNVSITTDIHTRFTGDVFESGTTYYEVGGTVVDRTFTETADVTPDANKKYTTKQTVTETVPLMFAGFNYYYNTGNTELTTPHAVLIPRNAGFRTTAKMNATNTTDGGYLNSDMHQIVLPCYAKSLKTALNNHLLSHRTELTNKITTTIASTAGAGLTGCSSGWEWADSELQLMNEVQLYGSNIWSSSAYDVGTDNQKLPVFNFINGVQFSRNNFWLRSVVSSIAFAYCVNYGNANGTGASGANYVRPLILFG